MNWEHRLAWMAMNGWMNGPCDELILYNSGVDLGDLNDLVGASKHRLVTFNQHDR